METTYCSNRFFIFEITALISTTVFRQFIKLRQCIVDHMGKSFFKCSSDCVLEICQIFVDSYIDLLLYKFPHKNSSSK